MIYVGHSFGLPIRCQAYKCRRCGALIFEDDSYGSDDNGEMLCYRCIEEMESEDGYAEYESDSYD